MKWFGWLLAALFALGAAQSWAQTPKIGFVDVRRIETESALAEQAMAVLKKEFAAQERELRNAQEKLHAAQEEFGKLAATTSASQRDLKQRELSHLGQRAEQLERAFAQDLEARKLELYRQVLTAAEAAVKVIAEAENFDLVIQEVVFANRALDITDRVLQEIARRAKEGVSAPK